MPKVKMKLTMADLWGGEQTRPRSFRTSGRFSRNFAKLIPSGSSFSREYVLADCDSDRGALEGPVLASVPPAVRELPGNAFVLLLGQSCMAAKNTIATHRCRSIIPSSARRSSTQLRCETVG
jgi:hypothetical protein